MTALTDSLLDRTPHIQPCLVQLLPERTDHNNTDYCKNRYDDSDGEDAGSSKLFAETDLDIPE